MSKTIYFRETDPQTGKAKWIKIDGIKGTKSMIFIDREKFEVNPFEDNKIFFFDLSEDEKLRLMTRK